MEKNKKWMDTFRTKSKENIYVLKVRVIEEGVKVKDIVEVVDCPGGEVGVWYAHNLLCRLANEVAKGSKMEKIPWREVRNIAGGVSYFYVYKKVKDSENNVYAEIEWIKGRVPGVCREAADLQSVNSAFTRPRA